MYLWDVKTGEQKETFTTPAGRVGRIWDISLRWADAYHGSGKRHTIQLWDGQQRKNRQHTLQVGI